MKIAEKIQKNINLAEYSTFKIGGPAEFFIKIKTVVELIEAVSWAKTKGMRLTVIGGGSNILISDKGVSGLVLKMEIDEFEWSNDKLTAGAGASLSRAVLSAYENSLSGLEWAIGIPGTIGGAVRGNSGAFKAAMADCIEKINIYNTDKNIMAAYAKLKCGFEYRSSIFKSNNNLIILDAVIRLTKKNRSEIKEKMDNNLKRRILNLPKGPTAGSIFKNVPVKDLGSSNRDLLIRAEKENVVKDEKIPAGWIIDQLDLKGKIINGAKISEEHANVIINYQKAASDDIITLISIIKTKARNELKLQLIEEIEYIGF